MFVPYVYAEQILLTGFVMDLLILYCALKILDISAPLWRVAVAALFSSTGAAVLMTVQLPLLGRVFLRWLLFFCMISIVMLSAKAILYVQFSVCVWLIAAFCGGVCFVVTCYANTCTYLVSEPMLVLHLPAYLWSAGAVMGLLCILLFRNWLKQRQIRKSIVRVQIHLKERCYTCFGYHDSGNLYTDPLTGRSVVVVCAEVFWDLYKCLPKNTDDLLVHCERSNDFGRMFPVILHTISGVDTLVAFSPDELLIDSVSAYALVALYFSKLDEKDRFQALIPNEILKRV